MIEMLGVLAIIGVLSVGGIAGYTKAMEMYHTNMQKQQFMDLFASAIRLRPQLNPKDSKTELAVVFDALNIIPQGLTYHSSYLYDKFDNHISIAYGLEDSDILRYIIRISYNKPSSFLAKQSESYCLSALAVAKENHSEIYSISYIENINDTTSSSNLYTGDLHPRCLADSTNCIRNASPIDMKQKCNLCQSETCQLNIYLNP